MSDGNILKIIDYEYSHFKYKDVHYGNNTMDAFDGNVFHDRSFIMHDAYKFICYTLQILNQHMDNFIEYNFINVLKYFFGKKRITIGDHNKICDELKNQIKFRYYLTYSKETAHINTEMWAEFKQKYKLDDMYNPIPNLHHDLTIDGLIEHINNICIESVGMSPICQFEDLDPNIEILQY